MPKKISSLSVALGGTVAPFVKAFGSAGGAVTGFTSKLSSAGAGILKFTGLGAGLALGMRALNKLIMLPHEALAAAKFQIEAEKKLESVLAATGNAAGFTAQQLKDHAAALQSATTFGDEGIIEFQSILATFKSVAGNTFTEATELALDMATVMKQDLKVTAVQLGKALNDPIAGVTALRRVGVSFTAQQLSQIKTLQTSGDLLGAQAIILKELRGEFGGAAQAIAKTPFGKMAQLGNLLGDLKEKIGSILVGIIGAFSGGLDIGPAIQRFSGWLAAGQGAVERWASVGAGAIRWLASAIYSGFSAIREFVTPIVAAIGDFIARNWQANLAAATGYLFALWGTVRSVFGAAWNIVSTVAAALVSAWSWAMGALGIETAQTGSTIANAFQTIADASRWLLDKVTLALNVISYSVTHWRDTFQLAAAEIALFVVHTGNQIAYTFTDVIPGLLKWLGDNWRDVFTTLMNFTSATFSNMATNAGNFFKALWSAISGDGFDFTWTPLLKGFESTLKELPKIAERQIGPLEQALADQADALRGSFGTGLGQYLADQQKDVDAATRGLTDTLNGIGDMLKAPDVPAVDIPTPTIPPPDTSALDGLSAKAKKSKVELKAIFAGSAESQLARFQARFAPGVRAAAATPKAAPIASDAARAMREGRDQGKKLDAIAEQGETGNQILADIRDTLEDDADLAAAEF